MRFHWFKDLATKEVETLRFTRAVFGLITSPLLLGEGGSGDRPTLGQSAVHLPKRS